MSMYRRGDVPSLTTYVILAVLIGMLSIAFATKSIRPDKSPEFNALKAANSIVLYINALSSMEEGTAKIKLNRSYDVKIEYIGRELYEDVLDVIVFFIDFKREGLYVTVTPYKDDEKGKGSSAFILSYSTENKNLAAQSVKWSLCDRGENRRSGERYVCLEKEALHVCATPEVGQYDSEEECESKIEYLETGGTISNIKWALCDRGENRKPLLASTPERYECIEKISLAHAACGQAVELGRYDSIEECKAKISPLEPVKVATFGRPVNICIVKEAGKELTEVRAC